MTHSMPPQPPDRAEDAFRAAFAQRARHDFVPLDPALLSAPDARPTASAPPRARWPWAVAAVLVVALALPVTTWLRTLAAPPQTTAAAPASSASFPAPAAGFRYASMLDAVVQVPQSWGYAPALQSDWCVEGKPAASGPFVDVAPLGRAVRAIGCPPVPAALQTLHLTWGRAADAVVATDAPGWGVTSRIVGRTRLSVVHTPADAGLAEQILASARAVEADHLGCPTTSPVQGDPVGVRRPTSALTLASMGVPTAAVVCLYDRLVEPGPHLLGSRRLDAAAAAALAASMTGEPVLRSVPAVDTTVCLPDDAASQGGLATVRFATPAGDADVWVRLAGCRGGVFLDDGASVRSASRASCAPLFGDAVRRWTWLGPEADLCAEI